MKFLHTNNHSHVALELIPVLSYDDFRLAVIGYLGNPEYAHIVNYFVYPMDDKLKFIIILADEKEGILLISSHEHIRKETLTLKSITQEHLGMHIFEREIAENYGVTFAGHPWMKPVRYAWNRADQSSKIKDYPFYQISGNELHQVGVGPIHAGVIEPGHFRFLCNGEHVLHLEIQLGYQHRGVEALFIEKKKNLQRTILAESIAGDTTIGHTLAYVMNMEQLYGIRHNARLDVLRCIALEIERIAVHVGDLSALCLDIAYQLGNSVFGALRTPVINYFQWWCGNRFGRSLIRVGYNPFPFTDELRDRLLATLLDFENKYMEMQETAFNLPTLQNRFEKAGTVTKEQLLAIGSVGIPARAAGIHRDIRTTHPYLYYPKLKYQPAIMQHGDILSQAQVKNHEIQKSIAMIRRMVDALDVLDKEEPNTKPDLTQMRMKPSHLAVSMVEAWRGELCHVAITDDKGELVHYKVKDPSMHNWLALALAVRNNEISDFPICNKGFDLSYCGHDL